MNSAAAQGTSTRYSRQDHVHPSDSTKQTTLVSGTSIKTINSQTLLSSGNLTTSDIISSSSIVSFYASLF